MKKLIYLVALSLCAVTFSSAQADEKAVRQALSQSLPEFTIDTIKPSEIRGLYEVSVGATIFYVSEEGKYLLQGRLVDIKTRTDLTEQKLASVRLAALDKLGKDNMIIFTPKIKKYSAYIFTDIDCGYCRKLHSEIDQYLAEGITINYLFFPRAGKGSASYDKAVSVWCSADRNKALTEAKKDQKIPNKTCENPVDAHMQLGEDFGVKGTPMIVTDKGNIYPGYLPAKELVDALASERK
jgi:thiol:disulfide interchange protein DsbC